MERLDKLLANAMVGSRKEVTALIRSGCVTCNGSIISDPSSKWDRETVAITVNAQPVFCREHFHIMLNKPQGYICATEDTREQTVLDLLPDEGYPKQKLFPAGRLDKDTEGFVFLTTDGKLAHRITGPKNHINKKYFVRLDLPLSEAWKSDFQHGIRLEDGYLCKPAFFEPIDQNSCYLTIFEGKFHQVKRMFEALGCRVIFLKRVQIGSIKLDDTLASGGFREFTSEELILLETVPEEYRSFL